MSLRSAVEYVQSTIAVQYGAPTVRLWRVATPLSIIICVESGENSQSIYFALSERSRMSAARLRGMRMQRESAAVYAPRFQASYTAGFPVAFS